MLSNTRNMFPFTVNQRKEFENQSIIFKYIMSGLPIPKDLLFYISPRREFIQKTYGFGCFQMGHSSKLDPEPGRCRRTDGKKWRCSREAYPDSKYCDKHMHRGKNRSGRSVDLITNKSTGIKKTITDPNLRRSSNVYPSSPLLSFLYDQPCSSSNTCLQLNSGSHSLSDTHFFRNDKSNNDYSHGKARERVNEQALFAETIGNLKNVGVSANNFTIHNHSQLQTEELVPQGEALEQNCFSFGTEFRTKVSLKRRKDEEEEDDESQKTVYRFFEECRPLRDRDFGLNLEDKISQASTSATELSISIPIATDSRPNRWGIDE